MSVASAARLWDLGPDLALGSLVESVGDLVGQLDDGRSRDILVARLGLEGDPPTLASLGSVHGVSRERIRQLQSQAIGGCVRKASTDRGGGLADQLRDMSQRISTDGSDAFVDLAVSFTNLGASPVFIDLLRRLLQQPKNQLLLVRNRLQEQRAAERQRLRDLDKDDWIAKHLVEPAWWPSWNGSLATRGYVRVRDVASDGLGQAGSFASAKLGRDVQYESMMEFGLLRALDAAPFVSHYQEQPVAIPYQWAGHNRHYVPDVLVWLNDRRAILVEVKPALRMLDDQNQAKLWAAHRWCTENGVGLLYTDGHVGSRQLRCRPVEPQAQHALIARLNHGSIGWPEYAGFVERYGLRGADLTAMGLRSGWTVLRHPWQLMSR